MSNLEKWENIIKEKRKKTNFRDFVKEIASWSTLNLYRNNGKVCRYANTGRIKKLDNEEFQNAGSYTLEYDFKKGFFENFKNLLDIVPLQYLIDFGNSENSKYTDQIFGVKNGYLSFVTGFGVENIAYSAFCYINSANVYNSIFSESCQNIYFLAGGNNSYNIFYSKYIKDCSNIRFSTNLIGCEECIFCNGLQNQKYCFQNKKLEKEEYFDIKNKILAKKEKFFENYKFISKNKPINYLSENINGDFNIKCNNVENGFWVKNISNSRNVINIGGDNMNNFYDCFDAGLNSENFYGVEAAGNSCKNLFCSTQIDNSSNIYYSYFTQNCSFCIGCIGLKNKSYCILNKEYPKEEWYELADKIFSQMNEEGILGEFFPGSLNPFYFNDTMAYIIDQSFTKEEVEKEGYLWRKDKIKVDIPEGAEVVYINPPVLSDIPLNKGDSQSRAEAEGLNNFQGYDSNGNWFINPEILKKVIKDENGNVYKIIKMEYDFLMKHSLPLPEIHWLERIKMGFNF